MSGRRTSVAVVAIALFAGACADVAPYQRGRLAHPTMAPNDTASAARAHVQAIHEGAIGGTPGATSGCGCN